MTNIVVYSICVVFIVFGVSFSIFVYRRWGRPENWKCIK